MSEREPEVKKSNPLSPFLAPDRRGEIDIVQSFLSGVAHQPRADRNVSERVSEKRVCKKKSNAKLSTGVNRVIRAAPVIVRVDRLPIEERNIRVREALEWARAPFSVLRDRNPVLGAKETETVWCNSKGKCSDTLSV